MKEFKLSLKNNNQHSVLDKISLFLATGAGIGLIPVAPGTFGSIPGIPLAFLLSSLSLFNGLLMIIFIIAIAVITAERTAKLKGVKDPGMVIIDEIAGMTVALAWLPFGPVTIISQFLLFRFFDILKPFPINFLEKRLPGGWGIVMDDIVAGIIANILWRSANLVYN